ncbi:hypothetical protein [Bacillus sp. FJAT-45350]|uniref:hypothetical protein n=1 Tax=Bacillus sp. FJAT-45350 TaxID=2011014 RepID=UPI000BB7A9B7|nr:hypothetical protein [Bacillus sp. FJAT-45350]
MIKQWVTVSLAALTFLLVWGVVIFQLVASKPPPKPASYLSTVERIDMEKAHDGLIVNWNSENIISNERPVNIENSEVEVPIRDLRELDFSEVSTEDGIPIDAILAKLGLD